MAQHRTVLVAPSGDLADDHQAVGIGIFTRLAFNSRSQLDRVLPD